MGKGYALISEKYIKGNGEDFHLFTVKDIEENDDKSFNIIINKESKCSEVNKYDIFENIKNYSSINCNNNTYTFFYFKDHSVYYFPDEDTARIVIASKIKRKACGICVATLYANKK